VLPKEVQVFAALTQQQALLSQQQASFIESQPQMMDRQREQITQYVKDMQKETYEFIASTMEIMMAGIKDEFEADRRKRDTNQKKLLEDMERTSGLHLQQSTAAIQLGKDILHKCGTNGDLLAEIPGTFKQLTKLEMELLPDIMKKIQTIGHSVHNISSGLDVVPHILQELSVSHANIKRIETSLDSLPSLCNETNNRVDFMHRVVEQLKPVPHMLEVSHRTQENIYRLGCEMQPVLGMLQETSSMCELIRDSVTSLGSVPGMCQDTFSSCKDIHKLASDLIPLHEKLKKSHTTCYQIQEYLTESVPLEMKTLKQQRSMESKEQNKTVVDGINGVAKAVAKSQPLTAEQYIALTTILQQVLSEMKNPVPQPKMSFANAVVHVHKGKQCDDVIMDGKSIFSSPRPRTNDSSTMSKLTAHNQSADLDLVEAPLSSLTGRIKKPKQAHSESPTKLPSARNHDAGLPSARGLDPGLPSAKSHDSGPVRPNTRA